MKIKKGNIHTINAKKTDILENTFIFCPETLQQFSKIFLISINVRL